MTVTVTADQFDARIANRHWRGVALCASHPNPVLWDDTVDDAEIGGRREPDKARATRHANAVLLCRTECPVRRDCAAAVAGEFRRAIDRRQAVPTGIRGGHLLPSFHAKDGNGSARDADLRRRLAAGEDLDDAARRADWLDQSRGGRPSRSSSAAGALVELVDAEASA